MDRPRNDLATRTARRLAAVFAVVTVLALLTAARAPLKRQAITALEALGGLGAGMLQAETLHAEEAAVAQQAEATLAEERSAGAAVAESGPAYDDDGRLLLPDYREWVFVGSAVGLSYSEPRQASTHDSPGMFTHVYLDPAAYRSFRDGGTFPEGTTFVLEMHEPEGNVSIARDGFFEGKRVGIHAAVKDSRRFDTGWAYFHVDSSRTGSRARTNACFDCHVQHGAVDNVFTQFYPVLRELAGPRGD